MATSPASACAQAATARLTIDPASIAHPVSPRLYGLMTEEINHAFQGGLFAELINNNTFRGNWMGVEGWGQVLRGGAAAHFEVDPAEGPSAALPTSLKLVVTAAPRGAEAGVSNPGYWGIAVRSHTDYHGSLHAKADAAGITSLTARLVSDDTGATLAETVVALTGTGWNRYTYTLRTAAIAGPTSASNHLELTVAQPGTLHLQLVSLTPPTFHNRETGTRPDLMEKMAAMHPHFLRMPGGNYLEGDTLRDWYDWKKTIGPMVDRPGHMAPWTYWSTDQFGLLEMLEWTEDLKIEPVLAVYAGYALQHQVVKPGKDLEPYVQAALDEVEYVTGDTSTKWGAERAKDGHPAPFPLHYIEIGNEDNFDPSGSYDARFAQFALALRHKYPRYQLIATTPVKEHPAAEPDVIDDHYYKSPAEMFALVGHYDQAPRTGPKIFVGEWATRSGSPTPNFGDALGDAAWMTSMERNSDLIIMASYAPLFVNVNPGAMQWSTDLIGYDAVTSYASPSYYAQSLFGAHLGDVAPKNSIEAAGSRFYSSVTLSSDTRVLHIKLVNATDAAQPLEIVISGLSAGSHVASMNSLHAASFEATNSITRPSFIHPVESTARFTGSTLKHTVPPLTIQVIDVPLR